MQRARANVAVMPPAESTRTASDKGFLEGKLLIALPGMPDPRFERSVIFMCAHSPQTGSMGIIVNKPVEGLSFREVASKLDVPVSNQTPMTPVLYGGPVETGRGFVLHSGDYPGGEASLPVTPDISLTATIDILRHIASGDGPRKSLFALGYAGWGPNQIETELQSNGWIHCDADSSLIFDTEPQAKWSVALGKLGVNISGLSAEAGRA
jgi:putative transcriptional regulator